jgi:hypothetical protein
MEAICASLLGSVAARLVIVDALADAFAARHQLAANDDPDFGK